MGLLDGLNLGGLLRGALGEAEAAALPAAINAVLAKTQYRDLNGLVAALQKGGLNAQVQSWLGPGANLPITEDQLKAVLGNTQAQELARHLGLPVDATLKLLAQYLPDIVDKASPNGTIQTKWPAVRVESFYHRCEHDREKWIPVFRKRSCSNKPKEMKMRTIALVFASFCFVTAAFAEDSCKVQATGKSLHGAALTSFAKKCCKDQAAAQKLHGAAETSFTKKCLSDATAS